MDNCRRTSFPPALDAWQMSLRGGGGDGLNQNQKNLKIKMVAEKKRREMQARGRRSSVPEQIHIDHRNAQPRSRRFSDAQQQQQKPGVLKVRRLSVLQVQDDGDLARQQKLRRKSVVGEPKKSTNGNDGAVPFPAAGGARGRRVSAAPTKLDPKLTGVPTATLQVSAGCRRRILVSAVPLPDGVDCIDSQDDLFFAHWPEFISYARMKEKEVLYYASEIAGGTKKMESTRKLLMDWLLQIALYFQVSQEALYHTVRLVDATLSKVIVDISKLQLVAITSFLIATKLEEYYPPSIESLLEMTENSYEYSEVIRMELRILSALDFLVYGIDPMLFLNRYIAAASMENNSLFYHACLFFIDVMIPSIHFSSYKCSLKAAAAVYAAKAVLCTGKLNEMWTVTLQYYTGYAESEVLPLARLMLAKGEVVQKAREDGTAKKKFQGIDRKFFSRSRHNRLLGNEDFSLSRLSDALNMLSQRSDTCESSLSEPVQDDDEVFQ